MQSAHLTCAVVLALSLLGVQSARAQSEEAPQEEPPPVPTPCPAFDSFGEAGVRRFDFPAGETRVRGAEHVAPDGTRHPGQQGVDDIIETVIRSHRPGCTPIRLLIVTAGSDFDTRGKAYEAHVSVERAVAMGADLMPALEAARVAAVERGEIANLPMRAMGGGVGTYLFKVESPTSEADRRRNRWLNVRLIRVVEPEQLTEGAVEPSASPPSGLLP